MIINADDFGLCTGVNNAVMGAHRQGVLTSTTIMAGFAATDQAVELAKQMPNLGVGVHLNLLEGKPVSTDEKVRVLLNQNGEFALSPLALAVRSLLQKSVRLAIEIELAAQIQWVIDRGIKPTHLDSHKHVHSFFAIYPMVVSLARRFGIAAIRWPFEPAYICDSHWPRPGKGGRMRACKVRAMAGINRRQNDEFIKTDALFGVAHTGGIDGEFWQMLAKNAPPGTVEVMTHPGFVEGLDPAKTRLVAQRRVELDALCSEQTKKALADANIELTHYGKL